MMPLWLYRLLLLIAFPLVVYSGWKRCRNAAHQAQQQTDFAAIPHCFRARFGWNRHRFQKHGIWIHAVSVGETRSIFPLLKALHQRHPERPITVTSGSTQGAQQVLRFAPVPVQHQMIPYDYPGAVNRFLDQIAPQLVIMVETEIWPNLYQACHERQIPLVLANARIKEKSFQAYRKWGGALIRRSLNQTQLIASQFDMDTAHLLALGAEPQRIQQLGNLKSDIDIPPGLAENAQAWREAAGSENRFIWVAASTHGAVPPEQTPEEDLAVSAHRTLLNEQPDALLIIAPRHTDRFDKVAKRLSQSQLKIAIRSRGDTVTADTQVYLADTIGEMMLWYQVANIAFVGGSLVPFGGHNPLEPAALKKPIVSGTHVQNLKALYQTFQQDQAVTLVDNAAALAQQLIRLAQNTVLQFEAGQSAYQCFQNQSGALARFLTAIEPFLIANTQTSNGKL